MIGLSKSNNRLSGRSTLSVKSVRRGGGRAKCGGKMCRRVRRVRFGAPDASLTGRAGMVAVGEFVDKLGVVAALDTAIGAVKRRDRGMSAGQLLVGVASAQLAGAGFWAHLDEQRTDQVVAEALTVPIPASTTAMGVAARFDEQHFSAVEAGVAEVVDRAVAMMSPERRDRLAAAVTTDLDSSDVEVYGRRKQGVAYNYCGQRCGRPHLASWAEAGLTVAADLMAGNADVRPVAAGLLGRALAAIPAPIRESAQQAGTLRVRADAGYFTAELATEAVAAGADFAIAAKRNTAMWRAYAGIDQDHWVAAIDMPGAQVAACDYAPAGWPEGTYTLVRRVAVAADDISGDPRARRRRTIPADQLKLALEGDLDQVYAVSFIVTNIPIYNTPTNGATLPAGADTATSVEVWFRHRTDIEERIKEAKHGAALGHLPSGKPQLNTVWM